MKLCPDLARVNAAIPRLEAALARIEALDTELGARSNELERMGYAQGLEARADDPQEISDRRAIIRERRAEYESELAKLDAEGAVIIDLSSGSLGFSSHLGEDEVVLSWRRGEPEVAHYFADVLALKRRRSL